MIILGVESSCDETGVALYSDTQGLLAQCLYTQTPTHELYGGVVPELASRDHILKTLPLIQETLTQANLRLSDINGFAYTLGPGLSGALLVGSLITRTLAYSLNKPAIGVHHLEGHILAAMLESPSPQFPFLSLLVSGGHTQLIAVRAMGDYHILGESLDDAAGEAFDKTAKLLGLSYPGGPQLAELAKKGTPGRFHFPRPMTNRAGLDFSFSGLKTHALTTIYQHRNIDNTLSPQLQSDIAYAFEEAVVETLIIKTKRALKQTGLKTLVVAGGVGANLRLRQRFLETGQQAGFSVFYPRLAFCTDNGAMIAYAGCQRLKQGEQAKLAIKVRPRWPLSEITRQF